MFVNHLEFLDISENCHSSARMSTEKKKTNRGKNGSKETVTPIESESSEQQDAAEADCDENCNFGSTSEEMTERSSALPQKKSQESSSD